MGRVGANQEDQQDVRCNIYNSCCLVAHVRKINQATER